MRKIIAVVSALFCALLLSGCCLRHQYAQATCTAPATCVKCGESNGEALGHDYSEATCTAEKKCRSCGMTDGEALGHQWIEANCTDGKTCSVCGEVEGNALGHNWNEATCILPQTCNVCGATEGEALGHSVAQWKTDIEPTCTEKGLNSGVCDTCQQVIQQETDMIEHQEGDWVVTELPTKDSKGTRVKYCKVCSKKLMSEKFTLTPEELKQLYIKQCKSISYDSLSRSPGDYEGEYIKFYGKVVQVCSEATSSAYYSTYRVATSGGYKNVVYIYVDNYGSGTRILEDDYITFYGTFGGLYTYTTVMGASVTIPKVYVEYIS